jgi:hypothetical protein
MTICGATLKRQPKVRSTLGNRTTSRTSYVNTQRPHPKLKSPNQRKAASDRNSDAVDTAADADPVTATAT